jgi:copper(I)-binding protein
MRYFVLWTAAVFGLLFSTTAPAGEASVIVSGAWVRQSLGQTGMTAGYLVIENKGAQDDKLVNITTSIDAVAHLHENSMKDGVMSMKPVQNLPIKAGQSLEMKPGSGLHIMIMGLKSPLMPGDPLTLDLEFERAGHIKVDAKVRGIERRQ